LNYVLKPEILKPIGIIFIFCITPSAGTAMFYYYTNYLGFTSEFIG